MMNRLECCKGVRKIGLSFAMQGQGVNIKHGQLLFHQIEFLKLFQSFRADTSFESCFNISNLKQIIFQFTLLGVVRGSLVVAELTMVLKLVTVTDMHLPPFLSCCCHLCLVVPSCRRDALHFNWHHTFLCHTAELLFCRLKQVHNNVDLPICESLKGWVATCQWLRHALPCYAINFYNRECPAAMQWKMQLPQYAVLCNAMQHLTGCNIQKWAL